MKFGSDLGRFQKRAVDGHRTQVRRVAMGLFGDVVKTTPVDTGRLRMNWLPSSGAPREGEVREAGAPLPEIVQVVMGSQGNETFWLTNNLPYAGVIEYEGHSKKAPAGMVRVNVERWKQKAKKVQ